jgi:predicted nucleic acid-binding protein
MISTIIKVVQNNYFSHGFHYKLRFKFLVHAKIQPIGPPNVSSSKHSLLHALKWSKFLCHYGVVIMTPQLQQVVQDLDQLTHADRWQVLEHLIGQFKPVSDLTNLSADLPTLSVQEKLNLKLPDAVIAVTAIVNNLTIITRNTSDFNQIVGLNYINPFA